MSFLEEANTQPDKNIFFSEFNNTWTKIKLIDFLHPKIKTTENCSYYIYPGKILESKNPRIEISEEIKNIFLAKQIFMKEIRKIGLPQCLKETDQVEATFELRREGKFILHLRDLMIGNMTAGEVRTVE